MGLVKFTTFASIALALLLILGIDSNISAQGRGVGGRYLSKPQQIFAAFEFYYEQFGKLKK